MGSTYKNIISYQMVHLLMVKVKDNYMKSINYFINS